MKNTMNYKTFFYVICLFFLSGYVPAQAQNYAECIAIGDEAFEEGDFFTASTYYSSALWYDSTDIKLGYKCAEAYRFFNNYQQARRWYSYVINNDSKGELPLAQLWLALMEKSLGRYTEALLQFRAYYNANKNQAESFYIRKARAEILACQEAPNIIANKQNVLIEHLNESAVNTEFSEFNAVQLNDTALVFSALRPLTQSDYDTYFPNAYISKIYLAKSTVTGWAKTSELEAKINDKESHNANICFSKDHNKVFFTRAKADNNKNLAAEIFSSENIDGKWQKAKKLPDKINVHGYTSTHPCFVEYDDQSLLFFVSDRPGGFGQLDIWYSIIKDGQYQDPINLGSIINTPGDEITPYYHDSTQTLYFSSDWHKGIGGLDIFYSRGKFNSWSFPVNIGYPINSSCNDTYFTVNEVDNDGFFTSNRPGSLSIKSETCCYDIYSYEWQDTIKEKTIALVPIDTISRDTVNIEENINLMLPLTLYFHNDEPDPNTLNKSTKRNYQTLLGEYYAMEGTYLVEYAKGLSGHEKIKAEKDIIDFFENYVAQGFTQLKLFAGLLYNDLQKGNSIKIKIKGFCSPLNTTDYNLNLSMRRISSVVNFLKQYYEGVLLEYIKGTASSGARLTILEEPLGKSTASPLVSDNPNDKRNSIYSRAAAFERKVQIILYEHEKQNGADEQKTPDIQFEESLFDFGHINQGDEAIITIRFKSTGTAALNITGVETSCGCTMVDWPREPFDPGREGTLKISFNTTEDPGEHNETVTIYTNTKKAKYIIPVHALLLPKN